MVNIPIELVLIGLQFAELWLLFYKLYYQESKTRRILLLIWMILFRPVAFILFGPYLDLPLQMPIKVLLIALTHIILVLLAGGNKKVIWIMAVYHFTATFFIDIIAGSLYLGFTGNLIYPNNNVYLGVGLTIYSTSFLWSVFYYSLMKTVAEEALNRIPLRFWLTSLLTPGIAVLVFNLFFETHLLQLEAGYNNFLFLGFSCIILFSFNLAVFYLFINLASSYNASLLAGELGKTPPVYSPQNGLSPEFANKYGLSKRQIEITEALLQGKSNKEIAVLLDIEVNTVQVHLQNIYQKTGAPGRYALMVLVGLGKS